MEKEQNKLQYKQKKAEKIQKEFDKIEKKLKNKQAEYEEYKNKKLAAKQQCKAHELMI